MPQTPSPNLSEIVTLTDSTSSPPKPLRDSTARERKGGLACAECRRSKLKCDRVVPCQACVRRGCAALCPNGVMNATKGNKALQAHAQRLEEQVTDMTAKIEELESALAAAHLQLHATADHVDHGPQTTLFTERRRPFFQGSGSLAIDQDGVSKYHGDTAASEYLTGLIPGTGVSSIHHLPDLGQLNLPPEIIDLFNAFPFGLRDRPHGKSRFLPFIPPRERAMQFADYYWQSFAWMMNPITRHDFQMDICDRMYGCNEIPTLDYIHPHKLAVFFGIMSLGVMRIDAADTIQSKRYHTLSCAALSLAPIISEAMCATIQALYLANAFLFTTVHVASEECWLLVGLCGRLGYRIGLHRDGSHFNLSREEIQRRRVLFWELFTWDAWFSFVAGRAPTIYLPNCDTDFPDEENDSGNPGYHTLKFRYSAACLWPTVHVSVAEVVSYQIIIELDHKIRTFPVPITLQPPSPEYPMQKWPDDPAGALQQFCFLGEREMNILFLHRNYLAKAITGAPNDPLAHEYGGSVVATYDSAVRVCTTLENLYRVHPGPASRTWGFWSWAFSCCIILAAIVIKSPGCSIAKNALDELKVAACLFDEGSKPCNHPQALYILQNLLRRAEAVFAIWWGNPESRTSMSTQQVSGRQDELRILGGLENVIPHPPRSLSGSPSDITPQISNLQIHSTPTNVQNITGPRRAREKQYYPQLGTAPLPSTYNVDFANSRNPTPTLRSIQPGMQTYEQSGNITVPPMMYDTSSTRNPRAFSTNHGVTSYSSSIRYGTEPGYYPPETGGLELFTDEGGHENVWSSFIGGLVNPSEGLQGPY